MRLDLSGKRAVVCGSTQGIGLACAHELALLGADITLLARDEAKLKEIADVLPRPHGQKHRYAVADFAHDAQLRRAAETLASDGGAQILLNNTGGPAPGLAIDADPEDFVRAFRMHIVSGQALVRALVPSMKTARYGRIINIVSTSVRQPIPGLGVSNTIRGAVASWAKTLSMELGPYGITVNNILPGFTDTDRLKSLIQKRAKARSVDPSAVAQEMRDCIPLGRFGEASEIGAVAAFLASPAASYVSGQSIAVDGGRTSTI
mgnify:CR=1 FL=1